MSGSAEAFSGASITEEQSLRGDTHEDAPSQPFQRPLTRLQKRKRQQDSRIDETQSAEEHKVDREVSHGLPREAPFVAGGRLHHLRLAVLTCLLAGQSYGLTLHIASA